MNFPKIQTSRLKLRQITTDDLDNIFRGLSHPQVIKYYGINYATREETREQIQWYYNLEKSGTGIWWAIILTETGVFCGAIGFNNLEKEHKKAELGFWLLPDFWGKGYIREALKPVLDYAFQKLELHRIEAYVETENKSSQKTLQKMDFQQEGVLRDMEIKNGRFISVVVYARLNENRQQDFQIPPQ